jgi:hypothetical protein
MRASLLAAALLLSSPATSHADPSPERPPPRERSAFERPFGLGPYATAWSGDYRAAGVGGRIRLEPWRRLGVDLFGEVLQVQVPRGQRHDVPVGFHLYTPIPVTDDLRLRPFLGMCLALSSIRPEDPDAPRADDVLGGAHLGLGLDLALNDRLSLFAEAKAVAWIGHDRSVQRWTGAVHNEVQAFTLGQAQLGILLHLGDR